MSERIVAAFVPLVDCAVLVAAREQGFAKEAGIDLVLVKEPSWASLRDHLSLGHVDCAHALAPLPVALTLGVGHVQVDCIAPFVLGRGGNAVTVSNRLFAEMQGATSFTNPLETGRALAAVARRRVPPLTFGMIFPFSNHNYDLYRAKPVANREATEPKPFDRIDFSPHDLPAYLRQFEMHTPFADAHSL